MDSSHLPFTLFLPLLKSYIPVLHLSKVRNKHQFFVINLDFTSVYINVIFCPQDPIQVCRGPQDQSQV